MCPTLISFIFYSHLLLSTIQQTLKTVDITPIIRNPPTTQPPEPLALPPPPPPVPQVPAVVGEPLVVDPLPPVPRKLLLLVVFCLRYPRNSNPHTNCYFTYLDI